MPKTYQDLLAEAKARIKETPLDEAIKLHSENAPVVFLDCREPNEWNLGRVPRALFIPRGKLESDVEKRVPRDARVIVYCANANRSAFAADTMQVMGYESVTSMSQGWNAWVAANGPVES
ncbi:MAG TPA: rhodanese-like domain-containing protein [Gemmatimonadaceae bacterium]|nr:rhodanese-like domain-containing protein [Gemmatimonadaceae bacterium]